MKFILSCSILFFCLNVSQVTAQTKQEYIRYLLNNEDYYRAISELKELRFYNTAPQLKNISTYYIGYSYFRSNKYQLALDEFNNIRVDSTLTPQLLLNKSIAEAMCYHGMKLYKFAQIELDKIPTANDSLGAVKICRALLATELQDYNKAKSMLNEVVANGRDEETKSIATTMLTNISKIDSVSYRSPLVAGILSAVVPGAGQMYAQHYFDGFQALSFVGIFGYSTYTTYQYEKLSNKGHFGSSLLALITGAFHISNIMGASRTAEYRNSKTLELLMVDIRQSALSINLLIPF